MIRALLVSPEFSFDPNLFCSAFIPEAKMKGNYAIVIRMKNGIDQTLFFATHKDAVDKLDWITTEVNKAASTAESEAPSAPDTEELIQKSVAESFDAFWNSPIPRAFGLDDAIAASRGSNEPPTQRIAFAQPLVVSEGDTLAVEPSLYDELASMGNSHVVRNPDGTSSVTWTDEPGAPVEE